MLICECELSKLSNVTRARCATTPTYRQTDRQTDRETVIV